MVLAPSPDHHHRLINIIILSTFFFLTTLVGSVRSLSSSPPPTSFGALLLEQSHDGFIASIATDASNGIRTREWEYWCDSCVCGFNKRKSYNEHLSGKRHAAVAHAEEAIWKAYIVSGPAYYDYSVTRNEATRAWSLSIFMDGLQARSRSSVRSVLSAKVATGGGQIDPSLKLNDLPPSKIASLWRMLYTSDVPHLAEMVSVLPPQYVRVKELLESIEVFWQIQTLMKRSKVNKPKQLQHIYDVGCGHGLVGMMCAATFPNITVHGIDRVPRESYLAQQQAFRSVGVPLKNLKFEVGDLSTLENIHDDTAANDNSLLLCVHGCKKLTHESIELAIRNKWAWLSLPCCLQTENHFEDLSFKKVDDQTRFLMLCGAIASKYDADSISSIDSRVSARGIVIASSL
jgi:SAM-dependent methyltransferase